MHHEAYTSRDFGQAIRAYRVARRWTQQDLAEWLGVSRQTVIGLEAGRSVSLEVAFRAMALVGAKATIEPKGIHAEIKR